MDFTLFRLLRCYSRQWITFTFNALVHKAQLRAKPHSIPDAAHTINLPQPEGEHPPAVRMLSGCQQAVNKLSREKIFFAQTHFLESTDQNTNVNTKIPKNKNRRNFLSGCQEAVKKLSTRCRRAVGPALTENPSSTEVKSCQSAPQGVSTDPCQADTKKLRPALLAVQEVWLSRVKYPVQRGVKNSR